jgi:hypothetical protein
MVLILPRELFLYDISLTAKSAVILPYVEKEKEELNEPSPVLFIIEIIAARRAKMNVF